MITASVLGASGYTGGELLRLLLQHPEVEVVSATSNQLAGSYVHRAHPNLRGATRLMFVDRASLVPADVVFCCAPHGEAQAAVPDLVASGRLVVDLSADFRLADPAAYERWYGRPHGAPGLLAERVYGLPELHRAALEGARLVSGVGCLATAVNLALWPLARVGLLAGATVVADLKIGSSAGGADPGMASMHAERSRAIRVYAPTGHRHEAEVLQECGGAEGMGAASFDLRFTAHAVELVRGVLATCHVLLPGDKALPEDKELWRMWREAYGDEPFVRIVRERQGIHRYPDPKLVAGSNFADVSFEADPAGRRIVTLAAIDNLVKGAAGSAVQCMNLALGLPETMGLGQLPCHPV